MRTFKIKYFALVGLILVLFISCAKRTTNSRKNKVTTNNNQTPTVYTPPNNNNGGSNNNNNNNNNNGNNNSGTGTGEGYGDGNDPGVDDTGTNPPDYYSINNIVVHGTNNPNRYPPPNGIPWTSATGVASSDQPIFLTNSRFNVRVRAQKGPAQNTNDVRSINCDFVNDLYKQLQITICVRSSNGTCIQTHTFSHIPVGQVSKTKEFTVPGNTADPLVLEVKDVQWDYTCDYYSQGGFSNQLGYCPFAPVWDTQCVKFDIQFSTDHTKDLPGPRY